jgi:hypothetical protein
MSRLLTAAIACGFAFGLPGAIGQTLDSGPTKTSGEYKTTKAICQNPGEAAREQCAKDAKAKVETLRMRCENLTDRERRDCVLDRFVQQHDDMIAGGRVEKRDSPPPIGPQPK